MLYLLLLIAMIVSCYYFRDSEKNTKAFWVFGVILTLLLMFRYGQGSDYFSYEYIYKYVDTIFNPLLRGDIGFCFLIVVAKKLGMNFVLFNALISIITMTLMLRGINRLSTNRLLSLTIFYPLYYIVYAYSGIRQGLAMAIFIGILLEWLVNKKMIKYAIGVIIAATFHMSAIFLLSLIVVRYIDLVKIRNFAVIFCLIIMFKVLGGQSLLLKILPNSLSERASYYLSGDISLSALVLRIIFLVGIFYLYYKSTEEVKKNNRQALNIYISGFFIYVFFANSPLISSRLTAYIKVIEVILIANFIKVSLNSFLEILKYVVVSALLYLMLVKNISALLYQGNYFAQVNIVTYPYVTIFNKDEIYSYRNMKSTIHLDMYPNRYQWPVKEPINFKELPELK